MSFRSDMSLMQSGQRYEDAARDSRQVDSGHGKERDQKRIAFLQDSARYLELECTPDTLSDISGILHRQG